MKNIQKKISLLAILCFSFSVAYAQTIKAVDSKGTIVDIVSSPWLTKEGGTAIYNKNSGNVVIGNGTEPATVNANAALQFTQTDKGIMIPKVALVELFNSSPFAALGPNDEGLLVYNTATGGLAPFFFSPGFYYWSAINSWIPLIPRNGNVLFSLTGGFDGDISGLATQTLIKPNAVTTGKIANNAVTNAKLQHSTITINGTPVVLGESATITPSPVGTPLGEAKIWVGDGDDIAQEVQMSGDVTMNSSGFTTIGNEKVTTSKIANGAVTNDKIGALAVSTSKIADAAVTTGKIADNAVTEIKIANLAVTNGKIGALAVGTGKIADAAVETDKIKDLNVTEGKIANGAVTNNKIGASAVGAGKIADGAVTEAKIGGGAVTEAKIATNAVTTDKILNANVTNAKLANPTFTINGTTITLGQQDAIIANSTVGSELAAAAIWVGNENDLAQPVFMQGEVSMESSGVTTIQPSAVTYGKIQNVVNNNSVLGRVSGANGVIEEIATTGTGNVVRADSPTFTGDAKAVTPTAGDTDTSIATTAFVTSAVTTANATNANLTGPITSVGNATSVASQTGTGSTFVMNTSPTLVIPVLGAATATSINLLKLGLGNGALPSNIAIGDNALNANSSGTNNTAIGFEALNATTTGNFNLAIGYQALKTNVSGIKNTAIGFEALKKSTGSFNVAIGPQALALNTTGANNVAIGAGSGGFEHAALANNETGFDNVAVGYNTLVKNKSGTSNIAIGSAALYNNTNANNIAIGSNALENNTSGDQNIAIGSQARRQSASGIGNIVIGNNTNSNGDTANNSVIIGYQAASTQSTVNSSSFIGDNNTAIGYRSTFFNNNASIISNATAIGNGAIVNASNTIQLGNTAVTDVKTSGKLKTGAVTYPNTIGVENEILTMGPNGVAYWNTPASNSYEGTNLIGPIKSVGNQTEVTSQTGTGTTFVMDTSPTIATATLNSPILTTPVLGVATATSINSIKFGLGGGSIASNLAIGESALSANVSGTKNVAIGSNTLQSSTGSFNVAIGQQALSANTEGVRNIAIGAGEGSGVHAALAFNTTGTDNIAVGHNALTKNVSGSNNIAIGSAALQKNTGSANSNIAIGSTASLENLSGNQNIAIGVDARRNSTEGIGNIAIGSYSNSKDNKSNNSVFIGYYSASNTSTVNGIVSGTNYLGDNNTAIGYQSTFFNNNTSLITNATAIGNGANANASNMIRLGNSAITVIQGQVGFSAASDIRLKKNIVNTNYGLSTVLNLRPVEYNLISNDLKQVGFIAQEVQKLVPEVVTGKEGNLENGEILGITYSNLVPVLTKAIQEQQVQITGASEINHLQTLEIAELKAKLQKQQAELNELKALFQKLLATQK